MNDNHTKERLHGKTRQAISEYLQRRDGRRMVSTSDTIAYLRGRFPLVETSDLLLADVVAGEAIVLGLDVELDDVSTTLSSTDGRVALQTTMMLPNSAVLVGNPGE